LNALEELSWVRERLAVIGRLVVAVAISGPACGPADDVSVGEEGGALNVARCFGSGTSCSRALDTKEVAPSSYRSCGPSERRPLERIFSRDLNADACAALECGLLLERVATAPDGSVWVLGRLQRGGFEDRTLIVSHLSVEGMRLGYAEVVSTRDVHTELQGELAVDDRGHAYVVWYSSYVPSADVDAEEAVWLHEYDAGAQPVGAPLAFRGAAWTLVQAAGSAIALAGNAPDGAEQGFIAQLDRSGSLRFNQTNVPTVGAARGNGVSGLTLSADGQTTLLAERERWDDGSVTLGLTRFAANGNALWDRALTSGYEPGYASVLDSDSAGNVTSWALLSRSLYPTPIMTAFTQMESFDATGQLRWAMRLETPGWDFAAFAIEPASGRIFASSDGILEITSDGSACRVLEPSSPRVSALAAGKRSDLYAIAGGTLTRYGGLSAQ
jgi:hypothetical protein